MKYIITFLLPLFLTSCVAIPFPHTAVPNSNISGQVVDTESGNPIENIEVKLAWAGKECITDKSGQFKFKAEWEWYYCIAFTLLPIHPPRGNDKLEFYDNDCKRHQNNNYYRSSAIEVNSLIYPRIPIVGCGRNEINLETKDDLGIIKILRIDKEFNHTGAGNLAPLVARP